MTAPAELADRDLCRKYGGDRNKVLEHGECTCDDRLVPESGVAIEEVVRREKRKAIERLSRRRYR